MEDPCGKWASEHHGFFGSSEHVRTSEQQIPAANFPYSICWFSGGKLSPHLAGNEATKTTFGYTWIRFWCVSMATDSFCVMCHSPWVIVIDPLVEGIYIYLWPIHAFLDHGTHVFRLNHINLRSRRQCEDENWIGVRIPKWPNLSS